VEAYSYEGKLSEYIDSDYAYSDPFYVENPLEGLRLSSIDMYVGNASYRGTRIYTDTSAAGRDGETTSWNMSVNPVLTYYFNDGYRITDGIIRPSSGNNPQLNPPYPIPVYMNIIYSLSSSITYYKSTSMNGPWNLTQDPTLYKVDGLYQYMKFILKVSNSSISQNFDITSAEIFFGRPPIA
jgi:hypothetical protein